jgi:gliding motility-associated-like protein
MGRFLLHSKGVSLSKAKHFYLILLFLANAVISNKAQAQSCFVSYFGSYSTPQCFSQNVWMGAGEYGTMYLESGVSYQFLHVSNGSFSSGICINGSFSGSDFIYTAPSTGNYNVSAYRSSWFWNWNSANIEYYKVTPGQPGSISGAATVCSGSSATYSIGGVSYATNYRWEYSINNGVNWIPLVSNGGTSYNMAWPSIVTNIARIRVRAENGGCASAWREFAVNIVDQPTAPTTATYSPVASEVCKNQTVGLTGAATGGVNQGCTTEYRFTTNGGNTWSSASTSLPTGLSSSVSGANLIRIEARRVSCSTSGCNSTGWNQIAAWSVDVTSPTVLTQNINVYLNSSGTYTISANDVNNGSSDNCSIASITVSQTTFDCTDLGANPVVLTVTDNAGNSSTGNAVVTVIDNTSPQIATQNITVALDSTGTADVTTAQINGGSTDNCSVTLYMTPSSFDCNDIGANSVLVFAADPSNNVSFGSATVTIVDNINPTITAPANLTVNANSSCNATGVALGTPVTWDNCDIQSVTNNAPATFPVGVTTVTWTATDDNGNTATATQTVTVVDNTDPIITGPSVFTTSAVANCQLPNASSGFGIVVSDNCGVATLTNNGPANFNLGYNSITWTVTDNSGNTSTLNQVIQVIDNVNPVITPGANVTVNANANCQANSVALAIPAITDNCVIDTFYNNAPAVYPIGTTTVTWTAIDESGNTSTVTQTVTVVDNSNPVIACPSGSPFTRSNTIGVCGYVVSGNEFNPIASDNCGAVTLSHNFNGTPSASSLAGATLPIGNTTVVWMATDAAGNTSTCSITVTVSDTEAPVIQNCPSGLTLSLGQYSCGSTPNWIAPNAVDNCGTVTIVQTSGPSPTTLLTVGTYTVVYAATDAAGNTSTCTFSINVVNTTAPVIVCPNTIVEGTNTNNCFWTSDIQVNPIQASGNCPVTSWSILNPNLTVTTGTGNAQGYNFSIGTSTITYTITDNTSATQTCSSTITIVDDVNPTISAPAVVTLTANANCQTSSGLLGSPVTSDNCTVQSVTNNAPAIFSLGSTNVLWTVTDAAGNTSTVNQIVNVIDLTAPILTCPNSFTLNNSAGQCDYTENGTALNVTATDNCTISSLVHNFNAAPSLTTLNGATFPVGTTNVTWTVTDNSGNTASCIVPITVIDLEAPEFVNCPGNISIGTYTGCTGTTWTPPTATDNCSNATVTQTSGPQPGANLTVGTYTVAYNAVDGSGNSATCSFVITVTNSTNPVVVCPDTITTSPTIPTGCDWISTSGSLTPILVAGNCPTVLSYEIINPNGTSSNGTGNASGYTFANGTSNVIYTITDANNVTSTCSTAVQVIENVAPIIIPPTNISVFAGSSCTIGSVNLGTPVTADNCSVASVSNNAPTTFPIGLTSVVWIVTDASGNTATATQTVTVLDNTNPTITAPVNLTINANTTCTATGVVLGNPTTADNCTVASVSNNAPSTFPIGITNVTWTVTDAAGNTATGTQLVTVIDNTNPTISAPVNITVNANTSCAAFNVNLGVPVTSDNCSVASVANNAPSVFSIGTTTVTWTVLDASGNSTTATQTVTVVDNSAPTLFAPSNITVSTNSTCQAVLSSLGNTVAFDNCSSVTVSNNAPAAFPIGSTTVTWTASDAAGNLTTATQTITVIDNTNPTITAPANVSVNANASCQATGVSLGVPTTADNCTVASVTNNAPATFPLGTTTVTWTVTDGSGNTAISIQTVTVIDNTNPTISAPSNVTVNANGSCVAFNVNLGTPTTADNCSVASVTNNAPPTFALGTTTVTWTVIDGSGNSASATQVVTVVDNTSPSIIAPNNLTVNANTTCTATGVVLGNPIATDNCTVASVTNNAPVAFPLGLSTVTWTATDAAGNSTTATQTITVIDNTNPTITAPANVSVNANASCQATGVSLGVPTTADNCTVAAVTNNAPATFPLGTTTVTWTVTDGSGNTATSIQTVTVTDNVNPTIVAPMNMTVNTNSGCNAINVNLGSPTVSDNCAVASITNNAPSVFSTGSTTITWTVMDVSGNMATATQVITVVDNTLPTIVAPANISVPVTSNCQATVSNLGNVVVNDNCAVASVTNNAPATFPVGTTTVTWTVADVAGNSATATQLVTVTDFAAPSITAPPGITVSVTASCSATGVVLGNAIATDDCAVASVTNNAPAVFPLGTTVVTWTAADAGGNLTTATQTVTVVDNTNPTITAPANVTVNANAACEATLVLLGAPTTGDNCTLSSVTNNAPNAYPLGTTTVTWTVTDAAGNTSTAAQTVTVVDNTLPTIVPPVDVLAYVSVSCEVSGVNLGLPYTVDNCSIASVTNNAPATYPIGETIVTWTVVDGSGNSANATQKVIVSDTVAPLVLTNNLTVTLPPNGLATITTSAVDAGSTDNCTISTFTLSQENFTCADLGDNVIYLSVEDVYGNVGIQSFTVTVLASGVDADFDGIDDACDEAVNLSEVVVPNGFTPDGDGINDKFVIPGLSASASKVLNIFNRYGNKVYESTDYQNDWDGTSSLNGVELPDDTYYYVLELDGGEVIQGFVYINRVK